MWVCKSQARRAAEATVAATHVPFQLYRELANRGYAMMEDMLRRLIGFHARVLTVFGVFIVLANSAVLIASCSMAGFAERADDWR